MRGFVSDTQPKGDPGDSKAEATIMPANDAKAAAPEILLVEEFIYFIVSAFDRPSSKENAQYDHFRKHFFQDTGKVQNPKVRLEELAISAIDDPKRSGMGYFVLSVLQIKKIQLVSTLLNMLSKKNFHMQKF